MLDQPNVNSIDALMPFIGESSRLVHQNLFLPLNMAEMENVLEGDFFS